jgi:host factor-I protein
MNKSQLNLQDTFLNQARKENIGVTIYLVNSVQLRGNVRGFDAFTILLDSPGKATQLIYKHSVTSIVPMRPMANLYAEAMRESGLSGQQTASPTAPPVVPAAMTHPDATVTVDTPRPVPAPPTAPNVEPVS